jgi:transposase InsO family protein
MVAAASAVVDRQLSTHRVADELHIPYMTVVTWVKKYRAGGRAALEGAPGRGGKRPHEIAKTNARHEAVVAAKREHPEAGSRRIRDVVKRFFGIGASETTVRRVLKEQGLSEKRAPAKAKPQAKPKRFERAEPNQLWQSDLFTFLLRRHERVYVAAFLDDHSRYLVSLVMAHHQRSSIVLEALAHGIADYGVPREILTDQGRQYTAWRGETGFEEELRRNGIRHVKSRPHHPQTCGKIERFWKTMWEEFLARTVFADFADCQRRVALFVQHYNFQRPHQALEGLTPADRFFRSAPQVRAAIEATVAANALRLAQHQPPRKPFYLVGRLGDQDLTISASGAGLKVRVGGEETTIPLSEEDDHETSTTRWDNGRAAAEAPAPADAKVVERTGAGRGGASPLPDGALGHLGGEAGDRGDRAGEGLARDLLSAGDPGVEGDARGVEPARLELGHGDAGACAGNGDDRRAAGAHAGARAPQAAQRAPAAFDAQVATGAGDAPAPWATPEGCAPRLDPEYEEALGKLEGEDRGEPGFDPDEGWRGRTLRWERKLSGAYSPGSEPAGEEVTDAQGETELHAGAGAAPGAHAAPGADRGGAGGDQDGVGGGAHAGDLAQSLPDDPASGRDGAHGRDRTEGSGTPGQAPGASGSGGGAGEAQAGERTAAGAGGLDRAAAGGGERAPARTHPTHEASAARGAGKAERE